jgi:hypothetical protein
MESAEGATEYSILPSQRELLHYRHITPLGRPTRTIRASPPARWIHTQSDRLRSYDQNMRIHPDLAARRIVTGLFADTQTWSKDVPHLRLPVGPRDRVGRIRIRWAVTKVSKTASNKPKCS